MNEYNRYYSIIEKNKKYFDKKLLLLDDENISFNDKLEIANGLLRYATFENTGYYICNKLEAFFVDIARNSEIDNYNVEYKPKTVLHILTEAYTTGGHTRVVERWINFAPQDEKHSVCLINKTSCEPDKLKENVKNKNGKIIKLASEKIIEKALELRKLALNYEYVVLHTHMSDPIATIAFGTEDFTRPVIFFNHAEHMFWIGKSISDCVLDIKTKLSISEPKRLIKNILKLPIPLDNKTSFIDKKIARKNLSIPENQKMLLTSGDEKKYIPLYNDGIFNVFDEILNKNPEVHLYSIGIKKRKKYWNGLIKKYKNRIHLIPPVGYNSGYLDYLSSADIVFDSYPMGGGTSMIDAIISKVPFLSVKTKLGQLDFVRNSLGYCETKEDAVLKACKCFSDDNYREEILNDEIKQYEIEYENGNWNKILQKQMSLVPKKHSVLDLKNEAEFNSIDDYAVVLNKLYSHNFIVEFDKNGVLYLRKGIKFIFEKLYYTSSEKEYRLYKIFNIPILKTKKK